MAVLAASVATVAVPSSAMANGYDGSGWNREVSYVHDVNYQDDRDYRRNASNYGDDRRGYGQSYGRNGYYAQNDYRQDRAYRGQDRYYRQRCGSGDGAVGTVVGGAGGALLGNAFGGGTLGTVLGGIGGALLGRHLDKQHTSERNGC